VAASGATGWPVFPYGILYSLLDQDIVVVAVMHLHRKPDYWEKRVTES